MILKLLGLMDIVSGISFVFSYLGFFESMAVFFGIYLIIKFLAFGGISGFLDLVSGIILMCFIYLGFSGLFLWLAIFWLLQKGFISMISSS